MALGDAIPRAGPGQRRLRWWIHLLELVSQGGEWPHRDTTASPEPAALMAERQPSATRH
jgi:hypothetical protein